MKSAILSIISLFICISSYASQWTLAAEDPASTFTSKDGVISITSPKGATLWYDNPIKGRKVVIEYEARIVSDPQFKDDKGGLRVSDLNCFWMADSKEPAGGSGKFVNNYALNLYYMGYGGNWNTTTRFRCYNGDSRGVEQAEYRPLILKEYSDADHLLRPDHWYKIRLEQDNGHVRYYIDGECLVDYVDPQPLTEGYFGFRTTMASAQLRNFRYEVSDDASPISIKALGASVAGPVSFGIPFAPGEYREGFYSLIDPESKSEIPSAHSILARWHDGSAKWVGVTAVLDDEYDSLLMVPDKKRESRIVVPFTDVPKFTVVLNGKECPVEKESVEDKDDLCRIHKYEGHNFIIRAYTYRGSDEVKLVHTLIVDSALNADGLKDLTLKFQVPMHGKDYERYVSFGKPMSVQPLIARRNIDLKRNDEVTQNMLRDIASWDGFRLSQLSPNGYSVRKRATSSSPWIGTIEGQRHDGSVTVGDSISSTSFRLKDFWQSYPSTLQVDGARSDVATVTISLYSAEAEPYRFDHYDDVPHGLDAAYEDVQPGMSTAYGIARTSVIYINEKSPSHSPLMAEPEYLHSRRAFGIWSLPTVTSERDALVETSLNEIMDFYKREIDRNGWYGYFNYGDVMHGYDASRDEWRYDVGGYAWDNTELGSPAMFWYQLLRTADADVWTMAEAMTRHCSEVDCYHIGPHAGLGSRHNVVHWGCGAKEARISEAWWNRFYYYLSGGDERTGDLIDEVADCDTLLYTLDPMRLAQPREMYPCSAPARLRIGPDWMAYASNWFAAWERTGNTRYLDKIQAGMTSIAGLRHGFFDGPKALGYDPATGIITNECDSSIMNTNHLMPIMGGFELINEMEMSVENPAFYDAWLSHNNVYKEKAREISRSRFLIPRLSAYAGWRLGDERLKAQAWTDLLEHQPLGDKPTLWTNDCATWTLDAIFLKEVVNK